MSSPQEVMPERDLKEEIEVNQIKRRWNGRGEIQTWKTADMAGSAGGKARPKGAGLACSPGSHVKGLRIMENQWYVLSRERMKSDLAVS